MSLKGNKIPQMEVVKLNNGTNKKETKKNEVLSCCCFPSPILDGIFYRSCQNLPPGSVSHLSGKFVTEI